MLHAVDISKRFAGVVALDEVSLDLVEGEVHALVGENGAGKSTLIKIITGAYSRDDGEITYQGEPVSFSTPRDAWEAGISTTYQEINLVPMMSVARNLYLGREPLNRWRLVDVAAMNRAATELLARYGIHIDVRRPVSSFGAGVRQMIAIVRAVSAQSKIVILDEPTSSLEPREVAELFAIVNRLKEAGVALLFVSHNLDEVFEICDRITILRDGRHAHTGPTAETTKLEVIATMLGREVAQVKAEGLTSFGDGETATGDIVLDVQGLSRWNMLHDVSFAVRAGDVLGLAGMLGSGRSETVRAVFGTQPIDEGVVQVAGTTVRTGSPSSAIDSGIALLPEDRKTEGIVPTMSVRDNIALMALSQVSRWGFLSPRRIDRLVTTLSDRLDVKMAGFGQNIAELSGGNQQKVLLARLLCIEPDILLLDEPTRGIDIGAKAEVQALIRDLAEQGRAVVLISSELEDVVEGSTQVIVLKEGTVVTALGHDEIDDHRIMTAMAEGARPPTAEGLDGEGDRDGASR